MVGQCLALLLLMAVPARTTPIPASLADSSTQNPEMISIAGAYGPNADIINGVYYAEAPSAVDETRSFQKWGDDTKWIFRSKDGFWTVGPSDSKTQRKSSGWLRSLGSVNALPLGDSVETKIYQGNGNWQNEKLHISSGNSGLVPLRPEFIPDVQTWITAGPKQLMRKQGKFYHEVELGPLAEEGYRGVVMPRDPQIGWLTEMFAADKQQGTDGLGDDEHGWGADGVRHRKWHAANGHCAGKPCWYASVATWPRDWRSRDVIGFAVDIDAGRMQFSLNGVWVPAAAMNFTADGLALYPAVSARGRFTMHLPRGTWRFKPPGLGYEAWALRGSFARPEQPLSWAIQQEGGSLAAAPAAEVPAGEGITLTGLQGPLAQRLGGVYDALPRARGEAPSFQRRAGGASLYQALDGAWTVGSADHAASRAPSGWLRGEAVPALPVGEALPWYVLTDGHWELQTLSVSKTRGSPVVRQHS